MILYIALVVLSQTIHAAHLPWSLETSKAYHSYQFVSTPTPQPTAQQWEYNFQIGGLKDAPIYSFEISKGPRKIVLCMQKCATNEVRIDQIAHILTPLARTNNSLDGQRALVWMTNALGDNFTILSAQSSFAHNQAAMAFKKEALLHAQNDADTYLPDYDIIDAPTSHSP